MATKKKTTKKKAAKAKPAGKKAAAKKKKTAAKKAGGAKKKAAAKKVTTKTKAKAKPAAKKKTAAKKKGAAKKAGAKKAPAKKAAAQKVTVKEQKGLLITPPKNPSLAKPKNNTSQQYSQSELFDSLVGYCGFQSRKDARQFYENFTGLLQGALKSGYKVVLPGLGKLQVRKTKARMGINPLTREQIRIPARRKVAFTANKALKDAVL